MLVRVIERRFGLLHPSCNKQSDMITSARAAAMTR
jgi:hypothetical protein